MSASTVFSSAATSRPFIFSSPPSPNCPDKSAARKPATRAEQILAATGAAPRLARVVPASRLDIRPAPEMVSSGIPQLDSLAGGLARGCLTEICGSASSGRTSILLRALAQATQRGEVCALIDASDAFHPASAAAAGVEMSRLLWVRCGEKHQSRKHLSAARSVSSDSHQRRSSSSPLNNSYQRMPSFPPSSDSYHGMPSSAPSSDSYQRMPSFPPSSDSYQRMPSFLPSSDSYQGMPSGIPQRAKKNFGFSRWKSQLEQMLKITDLLLQSNGFGMIALDLSDIPAESARRIPLASWFRFRRAVEHTPTALLVMEQQPIAGSCSSMVLNVSAVRAQPANRKAHSELPHSELLNNFEITAQVLCSRLEKKSERKPMQSTASFKSRAAWMG
jgi:recombination protein RecA